VINTLDDLNNVLLLFNDAAPFRVQDEARPAVASSTRQTDAVEREREARRATSGKQTPLESGQWNFTLAADALIRVPEPFDHPDLLLHDSVSALAIIDRYRLPPLVGQ
jgi:hypothetical protein